MRADDGDRRELDREAQRDSLNARELDQRAKSDRAKRRRRAMHDLTRAHDRGSRESAERLRRERASEDASLQAERVLAERVRAEEHGLAEDGIARERDRRAHAERQIELLREQNAARALAQSESAAIAHQELQTILLAIEDLPEAESETVAAIRSSVLRLEDLLDHA